MGIAHDHYSNSSYYKRLRPIRLLFRLLLFPLFSIFVIWFLSPFAFSSDFILSYSFSGQETAYSPSPSSVPNDSSNSTTIEEGGRAVTRINSIFPTCTNCTEHKDPAERRTSTNSTDQETPSTNSTDTNPVSTSSSGTIYCDRSHRRTDICFMNGDIRTQSSSKSIHLYTPKNLQSNHKLNDTKEKIKPYTRKWETSVMDRITELTLIQHPETPTRSQLRCDVHHHVPALIFSAGGYTGNLYHEFNDGIIPLYITSHHLKRKVVFVIIKYREWWYTKYKDVISHLSDYAPIDFDSDTRTHCFPEAIVGLRIHDELTVDPSLMPDNNKRTIKDFRNFIDQAYRGIKIKKAATSNRNNNHKHKKQPSLVLLSRTGTRSITNERALVNLAKKTGFSVTVVTPDKRTELAKMYETLNQTDVLIGVHGAAMTHMLFMRPGSVVIQIVPIGTEWPAKRFYEEPAVKLGVKYMKYSILPRESSLLDRYREDDPVIRDPNSIGVKGWEFTKKIYLDNQKVTLDMQRFKEVLVNTYNYVSLSSRI